MGIKGLQGMLKGREQKMARPKKIFRQARSIWAIIAVLAILGAAYVALQASRPPPSILELAPRMNSTTLYQKMAAGEKLWLLDVREAVEREEEHINGSIAFPKSKFDKQDSEIMSFLATIPKDALVVTYCGAGHRSGFVALKLREIGYKNAYNLDGISYWSKLYPTVKGAPTPKEAQPSIIHLQEAYYYYTAFADVVFVDVRERGEWETKGWVKGAKLIPLSEFEDRMQELPKDKDIVLYCEGTFEGGWCTASWSAGLMLIKSGWTPGKIKVLEDGYGAWKAAGYPVEGVSPLQAFVDFFRGLLRR